MRDGPVQTGTTIMAFKYKDGVLLAADSCTSSGSFVFSRITDKLTEITPNIYCCRSGNASDTQMIARSVQREIKTMSSLNNEIPNVELSAKIISSMIYKYNERLLASIIVAGYDVSPKVYKIHPCGSLTEEEIALGGSGSGYIYGYCDKYYKPNMLLEEALEFAKTAVSMAIKRDDASGGVIRMASITSEGIQRFIVPGNQLI